MDRRCPVNGRRGHRRLSPPALRPDDGGHGAWQSRFVDFLPAIRRYARRRYWHFGDEACGEAVAEVVAGAFVAYSRLVEQGRAEVAFASTLARYAVARQRAGRRVGARLNVRDVASETCQQRKGVCVRRLDRVDRDGGSSGWEAVVVEDRRASPADVAATRIDFRAWLGTLSTRDRTVAEFLATGESTRCAARRFKLSAGRISQLRRELCDAWARFTSDPAETRAGKLC